MRALLATTCAVLALGQPAALAEVVGPEWIEDGDAGSLPDGAQPVRGVGQLTQIRGDLESALATSTGTLDFQDMYIIAITDPVEFRASTALGGSANFDSAMWLFRLEGTGLLGNDDTLVPALQGGTILDGSTVEPPATDNTMQEIPGPGVYLLAITLSFDSPVDENFCPIFEFDSQTEVSGPDGPGGENPIGNWGGGKGVLGDLAAAPSEMGAVYPVRPLAGARPKNQGTPGAYTISLIGAAFLPPAGACCVDDTCVDEQTADECANLGGIYLGDDTECPPTVYMVTDCANAFEDIAATGLPGPEGDDADLVVAIGFDFSFFGVVQSDARISTNGYITFGSNGTDFSNDPIPDPTPPNNIIAPFWTDLIVGPPGSVRYETRGVAPGRRFIVQWTSATEFGEPADTATFQAVLLEGSNCIEFRYGALSGIPSLPGDVTIGVENAGGNAGFSVPDSSVAAGDCVSFCPQQNNICPATGACCLPDGTCDDSGTEEACAAAGGLWQGDDTLCTEVECCAAAPDVLCHAELTGPCDDAGDDDDSSDEDSSSDDADLDGDSDSGGGGDGHGIALSWTVTNAPGCATLSISASIDLGCQVVAIESGQAICLRCVAAQGGAETSDDDSSDDVPPPCEVWYGADGVLHIVAPSAALVVMAMNEAGSHTCSIDLCALIPSGGDDDDGSDDSDSHSGSADHDSAGLAVPMHRGPIEPD